MHMNQSFLGGRLGRQIALALGVSALGLVSTATFAAPVDSGPLNINVPSTIDGVYFNIVTGATGTSGGTTAGWDNNPYNNGAGFTWFSPSTPAGQGVVGAAGAATALAPGAVIDGTRTFLAGQATGAAFQSAGDRYVGLRFVNEATGAPNFGYVLVRNSAGALTTVGFPATIIRTGYCNAGEAVTIPATPGAPICAGGGPVGTSDIALFINNDAGYAVATGVAKTGSTTVNVGGTYSFFARILNNTSGAVTGGALAVTVPATSRYDSATCSGGVVPTIPAGPIASPGPVNVTGINFSGRTTPPAPAGGVVPLTCRFNFTAVAAGTGTHTGTVSQTSGGNVTTNDVDTFGITANAVQAPAIPVNSLNAWGIAALAFLLGLVGFAVVRRRV
jgi:hypothetical protein